MAVLHRQGRLREDQARGRQWSVHALACHLTNGPRPPKHHAAHGECHDPSCFNAPAGHVYWATPRRNIHDRARDGTDASGERNPAAKLTEPKVAQILQCSDRFSDREIARAYGVDVRTVDKILKRQLWRNVDPYSPTAVARYLGWSA